MNFYKCKLVKEKEIEYEVTSPNDAVDMFMKLGIAEEPEEVFWVACMNTKGKVVGLHEVARDEVSVCPVHPREIFKRALLNNAKTIICCHNHPSGDPAPSKIDALLTERLWEAGKLMGIKLLDHIILGSEGYYSFAEEGELEE